MRNMIYCEPTQQGVHSFYLITRGEKYFLFSQNYRKGVQEYFSKGVPLADSRKYAKTRNDRALIRTMTKLPMYIRYVEKEYEIELYEQAKKRKRQDEYGNGKCA